MSIEAAGDRRLWEPANEFSRLYAAGDETGAVDVAVEALRGGVSFAPPLESIWWLADQLRQRRHYALGLALADAAFKRGFRSWRIFYLRGLFSGLLRNFTKALNLLDTAISLAPPDAAREMSLFKGRLLAADGKTEQALRCFRRNLKLGEDPVELVDIGIRLAWRAGNGDIAGRWVRRATRRYGASAERAREFAQRCYDKGLWDKALKAAQSGLEIERENPALERIVCRCFYNQGKFVDAIAALEARLEADPDWTEGRTMLVRCLDASGRRDDAVEILDKLSRDGGSAELAALRVDLGLPAEGADDRPETGETESGRRRKKKRPEDDPELLYRLANIPDEFTPRWTDEAIAASGNRFRAIRALGHSVWTIMLREMMARFGRHDLGYLWALIEPLVHVVILSFIFYFIRMRDTFGMNVVLFVATGIIPLFFYLKTFNVLTNALRQNRPLLNHSRVRPMDIFLARTLLVFFTQLLVLVTFALAIYLVVEEYRFDSVLSVVANLFGLWIFGIGVGLMVSSLIVYAEWLPNLMTGINRLIYITSGVFFTLDRMPPTVAKYAAYNPLLHFVDGVRGNFNPLMGGSRVDIGYAYIWALVILAIGLMADRALRHKVLDR